VGGVLADRADRRRVIATFQSIQMLCPTLLVVLLATGTVQSWMVVALSLVVGVTDASRCLHFKRSCHPLSRARLATEDKFDPHHPFAGIRDIARQPHIRGALLTVLLTSMLCGPLIIFCPVLVKDALHADRFSGRFRRLKRYAATCLI
jgi:hypothetical protein